MIGYITVSKETAIKMIEQAPGENITFAIRDIESNVHKKPVKKSKKAGKEIIKIAKEVGYQDNDFFGVIGCRTVESGCELMKDILFPLLDKCPVILDYK